MKLLRVITSLCYIVVAAAGVWILSVGVSLWQHLSARVAADAAHAPPAQILLLLYAAAADLALVGLLFVALGIGTAYFVLRGRMDHRILYSFATPSPSFGL